MKRKAVTLGVIIICFLLQSTIFCKLTIGGISPNLLIIVTASLGFMRGQKSGMYVGLVCGLLVDLFWGGTLGFHMLLFVLVGYFNGCFTRLFFYDDIKLPIGLIAASEFLYGTAIYFFRYILQGKFAYGTHLVHLIIPELVYTILVTLVLYQIILHINKQLETEEQRSASKFV